MREFSFANAWAAGVRFYSGAVLNHSILLLGLGVLLPIGLQVLLLGWPMFMTSLPGAAGEGAVSPAVTLVASLASVMLPAASYFASWRLGLARGETLGGALVFGLLAGVMVTVGFVLLMVVVGLAFGLIAAPLAAIVALVAVVGLLAAAWTTLAALMAVAVCLLFLLSLALGAAMGDVTYAATIVGGSGVVWTVLVAASLVLLWLAGRLSCTAVLMAERKSFNLIRAMRDSWSLTWEDEWRIMRYLALLGLVMALVMVGAIVAAGAGLAATLRGAGQPAGGIGAVIFLLALPIPLAYLTVLVPVGIYRELGVPDVASAEVFA